MSKWDSLYDWLNDLRLAIAPDETVTDQDERHDRIVQVKLIDEIMECMEGGMIKLLIILMLFLAFGSGYALGESNRWR